MTIIARADAEPAASPVSRLQLSITGYFFRPGGAYSIAICRIALFACLYVHVYNGVLANGLGDPAHYYQTVNVAAYYPKGLVWLLFPATPPPAWLIEWLLPVVAAATICAIAGLLTRAAMIVSVLSLCFLGALLYSFEPLWSHPYNSELLAGLGFMFGRAGDRLSIDSLIARWRGRPIAIDRDVYWWPVILGMFGTASVYFGGFYAKLSTPDFSFDLSWVFSDNLRNAASLPWLIYGRPLPWQVEIVVNHPWIWKLAALGHLATQALPIFAMFSIGRPYVRLAEGAVFAAGAVLLKNMMGFWNPEWIILSAFFVDWEFFFRRFVPKPHPIPSAPSRHRGLIVTCALAFIAANLFVIVTRLDDKGHNRAYPFSAMTFYSNVSAEKPYSEHRHYPFPFGELLLNYADGTIRKWSCYPNINSLYLSSLRNEDVAVKLPQQIGAIESIVNSIRTSKKDNAPDCVGSVNVRDYTSIDLYGSILDIPPYPEPVKFTVGHRALVARYEADRNRIIAAAGYPRQADGSIAVDVASHGLDVARYDILLANDPWRNYIIGPLIAMPGSWTGQTYMIDKQAFTALPKGWYPVVVRVTETSGATYDFFGGVVYR